MSCQEQQEHEKHGESASVLDLDLYFLEELEVLKSIYEGDESFKEISPTTFQYKYGEENSNASFLLEISWSETYPETLPTVSMDTFYNKHMYFLPQEETNQTVSRDSLIQICENMFRSEDNNAEQFLDSAMTYTLFEWVKENYDELIADQLNIPQVVVQVNEKQENRTESPEVPQKKGKKEQLTKHQKRRMYEKMGNATGEKPRGWNWVDVVKHLSQTGSQQQN